MTKIKSVEAVKEIKKVSYIGDKLEMEYGKQLSDVWNLGLQLALRITDLLSIKFTDIKQGKLYITEGKTGKLAEIQLNPKAQSIVDGIRVKCPDNMYIFESTHQRNKGKPITREYVARAFKTVGEMDSINVHLGTHSMRKTRGYHLYKQTNNVAKVMYMLRHSSEAVTLKYIGITQEDIDNDFNSLEL